MKKLVQNLIKSTGYQIIRYPDSELKIRLKLMENYSIDTLLDIGANTGQYARLMRKLGYSKRIISYEPLNSAFEVLERAAMRDNNWIVNNYAMGNDNSKGVINIAGNSYSSSILNMLPIHLNSAPDSKYVGQQEIEIKKLDSIFNDITTEENRVMLKIDAQGYGKNIIDGAIESLSKIMIIQMEMSLTPLYSDEMLFTDMINYLDNKGFQLFSLENGFSSPVSNQLLQVDGIFVNKTFADKA